MRPGLIPAVLTTLTILLTLGCGAEADPPPASPPGSSTPVPLPSPTPGDPSMAPSPTSTGVQELTGVVQAGVEEGCLLLSAEGDGGGQVWLLVGQTGAVQPGQHVRVEGRANPDLMTTCQQGTPFTVTRVL